jgi:hypothetical protein
MRQQQIQIRATCGTRIALDHSNRSVATLTAPVDGGLTSKGARKSGSYHASVATATVERGYAVAATIAPNDSHDLIVAMLCGLLGADLPRELDHNCYFQLVQAYVAGHGTLGHFP